MCNYCKAVVDGNLDNDIISREFDCSFFGILNLCTYVRFDHEQRKPVICTYLANQDVGTEVDYSEPIRYCPICGDDLVDICSDAAYK